MLVMLLDNCWCLDKMLETENWFIMVLWIHFYFGMLTGIFAHLLPHKAGDMLSIDINGKNCFLEL